MSDTLVATYPRSLSLWTYVSVMLASTGFCLYGGMCTIYSVGWCHICSGLYTQGEGRACVGVVRWLYYSHYSMVGVVRCGNQKVNCRLDSLLLYGTCIYVEGCH